MWCGASGGPTCLPFSTNSSLPTPWIMPTSCCRRRRFSSKRICRPPTGTTTCRCPTRPSSRWQSAVPMSRSFRSEYADIVLPATTFFEQKDLQTSYGHHYLQMSNQAIEPLAECRPNVEVFRALAKAMGFEEECFDDSLD